MRSALSGEDVNVPRLVFLVPCELMSTLPDAPSALSRPAARGCRRHQWQASLDGDDACLCGPGLRGRL
jgi:hypothetical protein